MVADQTPGLRARRYGGGPVFPNLAPAAKPGSGTALDLIKAVAGPQRCRWG